MSTLAQANIVAHAISEIICETCIQIMEVPDEENSVTNSSGNVRAAAITTVYLRTCFAHFDKVSFSGLEA